MGTSCFSLQADLEVIQSIPCSYRSLPINGHLITSGLAPFLERPIPVSRKTDAFRIIDASNVTLRDFRGFSNEKSQFYLDESQVPSWRWDVFAARFGADGVYEDLRASFNEGTAMIEDLNSSVEIEESVYILSTGEPSNYGSWLYRVLPKLIDLPKDNRAIFLYSPATWMKEFLAKFAPERQVIQHNPQLKYHFKDARIASMRNLDVFFDDQTRDFYSGAANAIQGRSEHKKIYLSRRGQKIRPILNEDKLESFLMGIGFSIVKPEQLSLEDRIRVFRGAQEIVCPGGSGLFNCVFAGDVKKVIDIEPNRTWVYAHHNLLKSLHIPHVIAFGNQDPSHGPHGPWMVDIDAIAAALI